MVLTYRLLCFIHHHCAGHELLREILLTQCALRLDVFERVGDELLVSLNSLLLPPLLQIFSLFRLQLAVKWVGQPTCTTHNHLRIIEGTYSGVLQSCEVVVLVDGISFPLLAISHLLL